MTPDDPSSPPTQPDRATGSLEAPLVGPSAASPPTPPKPKPSFFARDIVLRAGELTILLVAVVGAIGLGLGMSEYFTEHRLVLAYLVAYAGYRYADLMIYAEFHEGPAHDELSRRIANQLPLLLLFGGAAAERTYILGGAAPRWSIALGLLLALTGLWLALVSRFWLGYLAATVGDRPELVQTGPFRFIRHPNFLGVFLMLLGWAPMYGAPITFTLTAIFAWLSLRRQILVEEKELLATFGEEYELYMRRTDSMIPNIW